jgi:hypothetical protein
MTFHKGMIRICKCCTEETHDIKLYICTNCGETLTRLSEDSSHR